MTRAVGNGTVKRSTPDAVAPKSARAVSLDRLRAELPAAFGLERARAAAWLEVTTLLEPYLLPLRETGSRWRTESRAATRFSTIASSSLGRLAADEKLYGMRDKVALRSIAARVLPHAIADRPKQPYRAPEVAPFFADGRTRMGREAVSPSALSETGIWKAEHVAGLLRRCKAGRATGMRDSMAVIAILSTQLWHREFVGGSTSRYPEETEEPRVRIDRAAEAAGQAVT